VEGCGKAAAAGLAGGQLRQFCGRLVVPILRQGLPRQFAAGFTSGRVAICMRPTCYVLHDGRAAA